MINQNYLNPAFQQPSLTFDPSQDTPDNVYTMQSGSPSDSVLNDSGFGQIANTINGDGGSFVVLHHTDSSAAFSNNLDKNLMSQLLQNFGSGSSQNNWQTGNQPAQTGLPQSNWQTGDQSNIFNSGNLASGPLRNTISTLGTDKTGLGSELLGIVGPNIGNSLRNLANGGKVDPRSGVAVDNNTGDISITSPNGQARVTANPNGLTVQANNQRTINNLLANAVSGSFGSGAGDALKFLLNNRRFGSLNNASVSATDPQSGKTIKAQKNADGTITIGGGDKTLQIDPQKGTIKNDTAWTTENGDLTTPQFVQDAFDKSGDPIAMTRNLYGNDVAQGLQDLINGNGGQFGDNGQFSNRVGNVGLSFDPNGGFSVDGAGQNGVTGMNFAPDGTASVDSNQFNDLGGNGFPSNVRGQRMDAYAGKFQQMMMQIMQQMMQMMQLQFAAPQQNMLLNNGFGGQYGSNSLGSNPFGSSFGGSNLSNPFASNFGGANPYNNGSSFDY